MEFYFLCRKSATRDLVENSIKFLAQELKLTNSRYNLFIDFERGMSKIEGTRGAVSKIGPNALFMILDPGLDIERLIVTVSHEMVHVKQYARGHMKTFLGKKTKYWMGKKIKAKYYDQPWEIEAFSKERILANKLFQIINE